MLINGEYVDRCIFVKGELENPKMDNMNFMSK